MTACTPCSTTACVDFTINPFEEVACIERQGVPLIRIFKGRLGGVMSGIFDFNYLTDGTMTFKMKSNPSIMPRETGANGEIYWKEQIVQRPTAKVATAAAASNTLALVDVADLMGIGAGSQIYVSQANGSIAAVDVASITGNTITLKAGQTVDAAVGACVYRGAYSIDKTCNSKASNEYTIRKEGVKHTYFRRSYITYEFNVEDFNVEKCRYVGMAQTAQDYLDMLMKAGNEGLQREFIDVFFMDRNEVKGSVVGGKTLTATETMGVIPAIQKAQLDSGLQLIKDYSDCCAGAGTSCEKDEKVVKQFLAEINLAIASGSYSKSKSITVYVNQSQISALIDLNDILASYKGVQIIQDNQTTNNYVFAPFTLNYGGYSVSFEYEEWMDMFAAPMHLIIPKDEILFMQRKFADMTATSTSNAKLISANTFLANGFPVAKFIDRSDVETNGEGDCKIYRAFLDYAFALPNICGGGYRIGFNFKSCGFTCTPCTPTTTLNIVS